MIRLNKTLAIAAVGMLGAFAQSSFAQSAFVPLPACVSADADSDGDGFGWENNASCRIVDPQNPDIQNPVTLPACESADSDPDGDGFGWENNTSCVVTNSTDSSDTDSPEADASEPGNNDNNTGSDSAGDEAGANPLPDEEPDVEEVPEVPTPEVPSDEVASDTDTTDIGTTDDDIADTDTDDTGPADTDNSDTEASDNGSSLLRSSSLPLLTSDFITTNSEDGDLFATRQVGDFLLNQNAWRSQRAAPGYPWTQTIFINNNGAPVAWEYDWGPGVPGANNRPSDDYYVRSYPELIYGIKDEFRTSAPKSQIGLPVRVDNLPEITIDYDYIAPEHGPSRIVDASVTDRFENGSLISGERNVAVESFLYESEDGECTDDLNVVRSNGSNHLYEVMVWLNSGAERLPAGAQDFVTEVELGGETYHVYTKSDDERYVAFVAQDPQQSGSITWNDYVDWARTYAHRVSESFGARSDSVEIQDSWCVASIIVGTEIFWGAGSFDLFEWTISQRRQ